VACKPTERKGCAGAVAPSSLRSRPASRLVAGGAVALVAAMMTTGMAGAEPLRSRGPKMGPGGQPIAACVSSQRLPEPNAGLDPLSVGAALTLPERASLCRLAASTWQFFGADLDQATGLPMDNIGFDGAPATGPYANPPDIAMYLWSVVAAADLHLVPYGRAQAMVRKELSVVAGLTSYDGFLMNWYSTTTGQPITGPGGTALTTIQGQTISPVNEGWYASALIVVREAFPALFSQATSLLDAMQFGIFYDNGNEATSITAGQLYEGYTIGTGPVSSENGALNTDWRIANYVGLGLGQLPGNSWWRTWLTLPADFTWQTQPPVGPTVTYTDPRSGEQFPVVEGHYTYDGIQYVPSWGGSEFEALMAPLVVPETSWGTSSFGENDVNYAEATIAYDTKALGYPVWGLSPASVPGTTGGYGTYGSYELGEGGAGNAYSTGVVAPYASFLALPVLPQQSFDNIMKLEAAYPALDGPYGLYDSVSPTTGEVAPRYLVLDEGMIMAGLDDALEGGGLQRYFAVDPVGEAVKPYLSMESFDIAPYPGTHLSAPQPPSTPPPPPSQTP